MKVIFHKSSNFYSNIIIMGLGISLPMIFFLTILTFTTDRGIFISELINYCFYYNYKKKYYNKYHNIISNPFY